MHLALSAAYLIKNIVERQFRWMTGFDTYFRSGKMHSGSNHFGIPRK